MAIEINELKGMLRNSTAVLILDNGEPSFVVLDYANYRKLLAQEGTQDEYCAPDYLPKPIYAKPESTSESDLLERINSDILALKAQIEEEEKALGVD